MLSQNQAYFVISQIRICDITKCVIFFIYEMMSPVRKKCAEYIGSSRPKIISAQDITISSTYTIIVLVKNKEGIQIWSNKQCHLFIFNCYTLSSRLATIRLIIVVFEKLAYLMIRKNSSVWFTSWQVYQCTFLLCSCLRIRN